VKSASLQLLKKVERRKKTGHPSPHQLANLGQRHYRLSFDKLKTLKEESSWILTHVQPALNILSFAYISLYK